MTSHPLAHADGGYAGGKISACCLVLRTFRMYTGMRVEHARQRAASRNGMRCLASRCVASRCAASTRREDAATLRTTGSPLVIEVEDTEDSKSKDGRR